MQVIQTKDGHGHLFLTPLNPDRRQSNRDITLLHLTALSLNRQKKTSKKGREPIRYGDLWMDFDSKDNPADAIVAAREFIKEITTLYKIDHRMIRYFLSGKKGCHICIPAKLYGDEIGHNYLPLIHKRMIDMLIRHQDLYPTPELHAPIYKNFIDFSLYCQGKGHLLR